MGWKKRLDILPPWMVAPYLYKTKQGITGKRPHSTTIRYAYLIYGLSININTKFINVNLEHL